MGSSPHIRWPESALKSVLGAPRADAVGGAEDGSLRNQDLLNEGRAKDAPRYVIVSDSARIAEVALWLMDHQMNIRLSEAFGQLYRRLPLKKSPTSTRPTPCAWIGKKSCRPTSNSLRFFARSLSPIAITWQYRKSLPRGAFISQLPSLSAR